MPTDTIMQLTYALQRDTQATVALARILRLARLLATAPRDDLPQAHIAALDTLREALATYDFWTHQ